MSKEFRPWKIDEAQLLPPGVRDYVPNRRLSFGQFPYERAVGSGWSDEVDNSNCFTLTISATHFEIRQVHQARL
ncbi:hypothetical protein O7A70_06420 [Mesorhizobium sp. Cs1299R1N1]|uniref:hypothetical protein n=1 Tax=Mesorhizobium sp. Cs1299R1N1 TaxID=3015172 RepID=UPI00301BE5E7